LCYGVGVIVGVGLVPTHEYVNDIFEIRVTTRVTPTKRKIK
jgi:hypothetical protein